MPIHDFINLTSLPVSGTYVSNTHAGKDVVGVSLFFETIRLDVDGSFPQMMASGSLVRARAIFAKPTAWIAHPMRQLDSNTWEGPIRQVWGDTGLIPHKAVRIHVPRSQVYSISAQMTVTFTGGAPDAIRKFGFISPWFRKVAFEFDTVQGSQPVTSVNTCAHAERPPLPCETLTFDKVYDRAGVDVSHSHSSTVPLSLAGPDHAWSDAELQAAISAYWSSYSDAPDWAVWVLFAGTGRKPSLAGSMFDDSDANQRQGVGIFNDASESEEFVPLGYPQRPEHLRRERFFVLIHETGHCFNLHHSWLFYPPDLEWPFDDDTRDSATFMNYTWKLSSFYSLFRYTFDDSDLKFLRHAPDRFVEMGDYRFRTGVDEFGRESELTFPPFTMQIQLARETGVFEFMEPVTLIVILTNSSGQPQLVRESVLEDADNFGLLITEEASGRSRVWRPFVRHCFRDAPKVLEPGASIRVSLFVGAGLDGWYLAESGAYTLRAVLSVKEFTVAARPKRIRIAHSCNWDEENLAQDFFTKDVGRAFAFGTSRGITQPVEILQRVMDRLPDRAVSRHAALALAEQFKSPHRVLRMDKENRGFDLIKANPEEARRLIEQALHGNSKDCFGQTRHEDLTRDYKRWLVENGDGGKKANRSAARSRKSV